MGGVTLVNSELIGRIRREQTQRHNISSCLSRVPSVGKAVFSTLKLIRLLCMLVTLHSILGSENYTYSIFFRAARAMRKIYETGKPTLYQ